MLAISGQITSHFYFLPWDFPVVSELYSFVTEFEKKLLKVKEENKSSLNYKLKLLAEHS